MVEERKEKIKKAKETSEEKINFALIGEVIKDNEFEFDYKDSKYKVRKPTFGEKQEAYKKRVEKELELIQAKNEDGGFKYKSKEDLEKIYKERGIDIEKLDSSFISLEKKKNGLHMKLGKAIKDKEPENNLKTFREEIENLTFSQQEISLKKAKLFESSLENQLDIFTYSYLTYLVAEKLIIGEGETVDKWVKLWNSYTDFQNSLGDLVNNISYYAVLIVQNEI